MFGMITAVGLSNLQFIDLNSTRNLFVLGFSLFFSLTLPQWIKKNPGFQLTGNEEFDQIVRVLLETSMFVGGFLGFFLDNTIPGTDEERGLLAWADQHNTTDQANSSSGGHHLATYNIPWITDKLSKRKWAQYVPFFPTYVEPQFKSNTNLPWPRRILNCVN